MTKDVLPLEENIDKILFDINHSKILYNPSPRVIKITTKTNKWDLSNFKALHKKGNYKQGEKIALSMGENNRKWNNWQRTDFQNTQAAHAAQKWKNKQPNQQVDRKPK